MSNALWNSLKTTVLQMGRMDLAGACDVKDLEGMLLLVRFVSGYSCINYLSGLYRVPEEVGWRGVKEVDRLYSALLRESLAYCLHSF